MALEPRFHLKSGVWRLIWLFLGQIVKEKKIVGKKKKIVFFFPPSNMAIE